MGGSPRSLQFSTFVSDLAEGRGKWDQVIQGGEPGAGERPSQGS